MKIGLIDVDGHNFPNLALMKLSAWHKAKGDSVGWVNYFFDYDTVYKSKVFTFTEDDEFIVNADKIFNGGTGYKDYTTTLPYEIEYTYPDYELYHTDNAYGFLTRGCPNKCSFCVVPQKEGEIREHSDIKDFWFDQKVAILLDNNVLAHEHGISQIEKIIKLGIKIDFNQGLDCRIIASDEKIAKLLAKAKWHKPIKMACDSMAQMEDVKKATELLRKHGATPQRYQIFVLVRDIQDALERVEFLRELNLDPFAQPYIDFNGNKPTKEQKRFARWVNHKAIFKTVEYKDYSP